MSTPRLLIVTDLVVTGSLSVPVPLAAPAKGPNEILDYTLDFSQVLNRPLGQWDCSITGSDTMIIEAVETDGGELLTLWLAGGIDGDVATINVSVISVIGQVKQAIFIVAVETLASFPTPDSNVLTINGYPLTWGGVSQLVAN